MEYGKPEPVDHVVRTIFFVAGIHGLIVIPPFYFLEAHVGNNYPPLVTHPEYYYGFLGVATAWQVALLIIGREPRRLRPLMLPAALARFSYGIAMVVLFHQGRTVSEVATIGWIDIIFGVLFLFAFRRTRAPSSA